MSSGTDALERVRSLVASLPETAEATSHERPVFQVRGRTFAYLMDDHHGDGRLALWVKSTREDTADAVAEEPDRFFVPPYLGPAGWLGLRLDVEPDWDEVAQVLREGWRLQAPKRLAASL